MDESSSQSVYSARCLGQEQYHQCTTGVFILERKAFMIPINETNYQCTEVPTKLLCQRLDKESHH